MSHRSLVVLLLVAMIGLAGVGSWLQDDGDVAPSSAPGVAATDVGAADASGSAGGVATDADASRPHGLADRAAVTDSAADESGRPLPDDALRVEVTVVDKETGRPVAGAQVRWLDETAQEFLAESRPDLDAEQRMELEADVELRAQCAGWSTLSDDAGRAVVTLRETTTVLARRGEDFGRLTLRKNLQPPRGGHRLLLDRDRTLVVRVLSDAGLPEADVPVTAYAIDKDGDYVGSSSWQMLARSRAPDGIATIRHLQDLQRDVDPNLEVAGEPRQRPRFEWRVRLFVPGVVDRGAVFAVEAPPTEPIELRLPVCGSIRVRSEAFGRPVPGLRSVWLNHEVENHYQGTRTATVDANGMARFRHVPIGQRFSAQGTDEMRVDFVGPMVAGQEVDAVLRPTGSSSLLSGRLVLPDHTPVATAKFTVSLRGGDSRRQQNGTTDGDGRFLVGVPSQSERPCDQIAFLVTRKDERPLRCELAGRTLRAGMEELGDLVLGEGPLLCGGSVVCQGTPFRQSLQLRVERFDGDANQGRWRRFDTQVHWDRNGSFRVLGSAPPARYRIVATSQQAVAIPPVEFSPGATDLVLEVTPGMQVAASVLLPAGTQSMQIEAQLVPIGATGAAGNLTRQPSHVEGERYHFQWAAVRAGTYSLEVRLFAFVKPLVVVPDLRVPVVAEEQDRLRDIDLRSLTRVVLLELMGPNGPIEDDSGLAFPVEQANQSEWRGTPVSADKTRLLLPRSPYDLLVCIPGYRPQPARGNGDTITLRLDHWPTLRVRVADIPKLPPSARLSVGITAAERNERKCRSPWSTQDLEDYLAAPNHSYAITDGLAEVAIGEGAHTLRLSLRANRRTAEVVGLEPGSVLPTTREVTVRATTEAWTKALDVVTQPAK
ncbi:MAG: hypothetical protein JNK15_04215 [Planctomycetes bacterium]|nr:hypothetical protein [Planctomycetota bacterium]